MSLKKLKSKGFTLIELMIVVAIIGILAAVAIPKFADLVTKSKEASIKGSLGAIRSAISIYYGDTEGEYPQNVVAGLTSGSKYLPASAGNQVLATINIPRVGGGGSANPGHNFGSVTSAQVETGDGNNPTSDAYAMYYHNSGNNQGHLYVLCGHNDTKGVSWSSY